VAAFVAAAILGGCPLIAAALTALPLLVQAGQGLINTVSQDVASFLGAGQTGGAGQNVPASAGSGPAGSTSAASPVTLSSGAHNLSAGVLGVLSAAQGDLAAASSFAGGQSGVSKPQLEGVAQSISGALHQNPAAATHAAGQVFDAIDTSGSGQITSAQLGSYLGQLQSQASAKYRAADSLVTNFAGQMSGLLGGQTTTSTHA
jgi:hypothetical protein